MIRIALFVALAAAPTLALFAQGPGSKRVDPSPVAARYLNAYAKFDLDQLAAFWDDQSIFHDPTTAEIGPELGPVRGARAIVDALRGSTQGVTDLRFDFEEQFHSGDRVVAIGRLLYTMPAKMLGKAKGDLDFDLRVVTVLRVEGDKIREHTDYSDFSRWRAQVEAAMR